MIPIITPAEMAAIDARHVASIGVLIERAGAAVASTAIDMLGGVYGRRVVVIAGKGNNGNDGRVAARRLRQRGVRVEVVAADVADCSSGRHRIDLIIDAAYGSGLTRTYEAPTVPPGTPVLAVDIPSGIDGLTGEALGRPLAANVTVTFVALKPGLILGRGPATAGQVRVVDIGLDATVEAEALGLTPMSHLVTDDDIASWWKDPPVDTHKWKSASWVIGGSAGMTGAPQLAVKGAQRTGAGYVRLSVPGGQLPVGPIEVVGTELDSVDWHESVVAGCGRFGSLVVGPGLGRSEATFASVRQLLASVSVPVVVDADALHAIGGQRLDPTKVLTPHDGEFAVLTGAAPGVDRIAAARGLAATTGGVALLKGPTTVVAHPDGRVLCVTSGDQRLATAGSGDVLAGMIGALLSRGHDPLEAAAMAAHLHGRAGVLAPAVGMVASDLAELIPEAIRQIVSR